MKIMLVFAMTMALLKLGQAEFQNKDFCNCGHSHAFDRTKFKCVKYPENHVTNCAEYILTGAESSTWECVGCKPQYLLVNGKCEDSKLKGCTDIRIQQQNPVLLQDYKTEQEYNEIVDRLLEQEIDVYFEDGELICQDCDEKEFYLDSNGSCQDIPKSGAENYDKHCIKYVEQNGKVQCGVCKEDYFANKEGKCEKNPSTVKDCEVYRYNQGSDKVECQQCEEGYLFGLEDKCVKPSKAIKHCQNFRLENGKYLCNLCERGFHPTLNQTECEKDWHRKKDDKDNDPNFILGCAYYGFNPNQNNKYPCLQCKGGYALSHDQLHCNDLKWKTSRVSGCYIYWTREDGNQYCHKCDGDKQIIYENGINTPHKCKSCPSNPDSANILKVGLVGLIMVVFVLL